MSSEKSANTSSTAATAVPYPRLAIAVLLGVLWVGSTAMPASPGEAPQAQSPTLRWYKGNTHTPTLNSDGDSTPDEVVRWYREHDYHFHVLTDHNFLTSVDGLDALHGADEQFLVIKGEEVSDQFGDKSIHALDPASVIEPQSGTSVVDVMQRHVDAIRDVSGVPHINHPSFEWAITGDELGQVENDRLFELFNGHPRVNDTGGGGVPGLEEVWDQLLTRGALLCGIAVDDAHVFKRPWDRNAARPGQGLGDAPRATPQGDRPARRARARRLLRLNRVELADYAITARTMTVAIRVQFIGEGGWILKELTTTRRSTSSMDVSRTFGPRSWTRTDGSPGCNR